MTGKFTTPRHSIDLIMVEDSAVDAELIADTLRDAGLTLAVRLVVNESAFRAALDQRLPDAILSDWTLPDFSGRRALAITLERCPDISFIFVSGTIPESTALEVLREGATDYVFKHQLQFLCPALLRALKEAGALRALRESENRLSTVLQTIPDLVWLKDPDGVYLSCNRMFERFLGATEADVVGKTDYDFVDRELADSFRDNDCQTMAACKPRSNSEWLTFADDGRRALFDTIKTPMFDAAGKLIGVLGVARDVTAHHKLEEQLRHSQKMESIGILAGGIAHDFNNILSVIVGYGQITLMKMPPDDPHRLNIQYMLDASDRAARLTRDLLLFSRKQACDKKPVDLNEIVKKVGKFLIKVIGEDIEYCASLHEAPLPVLADELLFEQVLMNLATNAGHAMPNGGALVLTTAIVNLDREFVTAHGFGKPGLHALLTVEDNGMGMDEVTRQQIFEPFFTTKEVGKGTGLGLAVVFGIIKEHDGYINVYSEPGMGATFRIYLPIIEAVRGEVSRAGQEEVVIGGSETILLAEDDEMVRGLMKSVLTERGYTVIEAVDGVDAVSRFAGNSETVDLLLLDLIMPRMTGKEAFDEIRKVRSDIKAIFSSGYAPDTIRQKVSLADGVHLITKPVLPMALLKKIREVLDEKY